MDKANENANANASENKNADKNENGDKNKDGLWEPVDPAATAHYMLCIGVFHISVWRWFNVGQPIGLW